MDKHMLVTRNQPLTRTSQTKKGDGHLQTAVAGEPRRPGLERIRGHVLLQARLLRRVAGDSRRVPAGLSG